MVIDLEWQSTECPYDNSPLVLVCHVQDLVKVRRSLTQPIGCAGGFLKKAVIGRYDNFKKCPCSKCWSRPEPVANVPAMIQKQLSSFVLVAVVAAGIFSRAHAAEPAALSGPWNHQDIGAVELKGSAAIDQGVFTLKGTLDTWGTNDGFHFVWQQWRGDGQIVARVLTVENTMSHAKAGVMFRESLAADAKHAEACVTPVDGTQFLARTFNGDKTASVHTGLDKGKLPYWVKLVRAGDKFSGYESIDGEKWNLISATNVVMSAQIYAGLVTSSHQKTNLCTATLDKVAVTPVGSRNP